MPKSSDRKAKVAKMEEQRKKLDRLKAENQRLEAENAIIESEIYAMELHLREFYMTPPAEYQALMSSRETTN